MRISSCLPLLLAATAPFAQAQTADSQPVPEKTHAQVVAELVQAYRDGTIPTTDGDYPAGDQTVQMNRAHFQAAPPPWAQNR